MPEITFPIILFNSFPEAMVVAWLGLSLLGLKPSFRQILLIGCLQTVFDVFLFLGVGRVISIPFGVHTVIQVAFSTIIYRFARISYKSSCLAVLLGISSYICIQALVSPLFTLVTGYSITVDLGNWWVRMTYFISTVMVIVSIIYLVRRFNIRIMDGWDVIGSNRFLWLAGLLFTQSLVIALFCWRYFLYHTEFFSPGYFQFYFAIVNIILPIITIIVIRQFVILVRSEIEAKEQLETLRHVEELLFTMRAQRHNFSHELQVVYGLLEVEAFQEAQDYLEKSVTEVAATSELAKTDNMGVTALLYTKTGLAEARKISLHITVEISLQKFSMEIRDVNLVLGNLIDNALDAVELLPVPDRKVEVFIGQELDGYVLEVKNDGPPISPDLINQIFTPGFSTKGQDRGMGLYSIQKLVQKYCGDIKVMSDCHGTSFRVLIPDEKTELQKVKTTNKLEEWRKKWLC
ncbi:signal transduction histidine kinase sporulation regulator spoob [Lucifera butyrica]|uniref:histidine kinase n=1 Tax=Lucifera butyrica TaxID=1351585 RepID=A0A498R1V3_9FIRM|nr:ATP-binding protein [Lucifera butyrica]VBB05139.1 signal transduction histidine kinase sporulation regulator spoob [Lucifera butyrica]